MQDTLLLVGHGSRAAGGNDEIEQFAARWREPESWWRSAVLNTAHVAWFSSDRTIREYAEDIWDTPPR